MIFRYKTFRSLLLMASIFLLTSCSLFNRHEGDKNSLDSARPVSKNGVLELSNIRNTTSLRYFTSGPDKAYSNFFNNLAPEDKILLIEAGRSSESLFSLMSDILEVPFDTKRSFAAGFTSSPAVLATTRLHQGNPIIIFNPIKMMSMDNNEAQSIYAHEMAHHYLNHDLGSCSKKNELEADQFAGFYFGLMEGTTLLQKLGAVPIAVQAEEIIRHVKSDYKFIPSHLEDQVSTRCHPSPKEREFWFVQGKIEGVYMSIGWPRELVLQSFAEYEDRWVMKMIDERN